MHHFLLAEWEGGWQRFVLLAVLKSVDEVMAQLLHDRRCHKVFAVEGHLQAKRRP